MVGVVAVVGGVGVLVSVVLGVAVVVAVVVVVVLKASILKIGLCDCVTV